MLWCLVAINIAKPIRSSLLPALAIESHAKTKGVRMVRSVAIDLNISVESVISTYFYCMSLHLTSTCLVESNAYPVDTYFNRIVWHPGSALETRKF